MAPARDNRRRTDANERTVSPPLLSVVIPVYNEAAGLPALFARLYPALDALEVRYLLENLPREKPLCSISHAAGIFTVSLSIT